MSFVDRLIDDFMGKFAKDIEIHLNPSLVSFYRNANSVQAKPVLYLSKDDKKPRVLSVGRDVAPCEPHLKIFVFDFADTAAKTDVDPFDCLTAFFRHCIAKVVDSIAFIRPRMVIHKCSSLDRVMGSGNKDILERSLYESGVRICIFK